MEQAALYVLVGQLRLSFDIKRWPSFADENDAQRHATELNKAPDQKAPNLSDSIRQINPHDSALALGNSVGNPILAWAMRDADRLMSLLDKAREWDNSAPYFYKPDYAVGTEMPFEEWGKLLQTSRTDYFESVTTLARSLGASH